MHARVAQRFAATVAVLASVGAAAQEPPFPLWREPVTGLEFVRLPAGRFTMGSPLDEPGHEAQETQHAVTLSHPTWISRTEVTQAQWTTIMGTDPSHFRELSDDLPVERVSLRDVERFLVRLGAVSAGQRFRLPTEAEWEYACRAGTTTAYPGGATLSTDEANYDGRYPLPGQPPGIYRAAPTPAGALAPNPWGLFDLNGNVWEWTADERCPYPETETTDPLARCGADLHVIRGGSWAFNADSARCAVRYTHAPEHLGYSLGFRIVREEGEP